MRTLEPQRQFRVANSTILRRAVHFTLGLFTVIVISSRAHDHAPSQQAGIGACFHDRKMCFGP
jgi:hypothetical protein